MSRKRKRSTTGPELSDEGFAGKKGFTESDYICPICSQILTEPHSTICGHTFCAQCITGALQRNNSCPQCKTILKTSKATIPNHFVNTLLAKYKFQKDTIDKHKVATIVKDVENLDSSEFRELKRYVAEKEQKEGLAARVSQNAALMYALTKITEKNEEMLSETEKRLTTVRCHISIAKEEESSLSEENSEVVKEGNLKGFKQKMAISTSQTLPTLSQEPSSQLSTSSDGPSQLVSSYEGPYSQFTSSPEESCVQTSQPLPSSSRPPLTKEGLLDSKTVNTGQVNSSKMVKIDSCLEEIEAFYYKTCINAKEDGLPEFTKELAKFLEYSKMRDLATITFGEGSIPSSCIASCIEFNRDCGLFAVGGVTQKVKIYDYEAIVRNSVAHHSPVMWIDCSSKLSSLSWNSYHSADLLTADYDGSLSLYDAATGQRIKMFQEHEKRCWSVHWSPVNPNLFVSASDDCRVKVWSKNSPGAIATLNCQANVCACRFHPRYANVLAHGGADHLVHVMDFRNSKESYSMLKGHKKTVSYLEFISNEELVSASTDNDLRLWEYNEQKTVQIYRGHINEKNFVGLSINQDYIACGSENNQCFVYEKSFGKPVLSYKFDIPCSILGRPGDLPSETDFVSSVAWRKGSPVLLAANSQGHIKILEMM